MTRLTHREYLAWCAFLRDEWNRPDRADHYAMLVAAEVRRSRVQNPADVHPKDMRIEFGDGETRPKTDEERKNDGAMTKAAVVAFVAGAGANPLPIQHVRVPRKEATRERDGN